jgi:hypothetical protein
MKKHYLTPFLIILLMLACAKEDKTEPDKQDPADDPWAELRNLSPGEVEFDGDFFCYYDCANDNIFCGQRIVRDCDLSKYHPDFFSYDCYIVTEFNDDVSGVYYFTKDEEFGDVFFVVCFCGRTGNMYSNVYSLATNTYVSCEDLYNISPRDDGTGDLWDGDCGTDWCNPCIPNCNGKTCGSDGCGGSCGTCPPGKTCSTSGTCIDVGSGDPCSNCLSACHGLPGCCTGCGCICESACGGCF